MKKIEIHEQKRGNQKLKWREELDPSNDRGRKKKLVRKIIYGQKNDYRWEWKLSLKKRTSVRKLGLKKSRVNGKRIVDGCCRMRQGDVENWNARTRTLSNSYCKHEGSLFSFHFVLPTGEEMRPRLVTPRRKHLSVFTQTRMLLFILSFALKENRYTKNWMEVRSNK